MNKAYILILLMLHSINVLSQSDLYDKPNTEKFALYLFKSGEYKLASGEYEKLSFFEPDNSFYKENLFRSYRLAGEYEKVYSRFNSIYLDPNKAPYKVAIDYTCILFKQNKLSEAEKFLNFYDNFNQDDKLLFNIGLQLANKNWEGARSVVKNTGETSNTNLKSLIILAEETKDIKYKSPYLSAGLSVFVPGLGKAYSGYWKDGLFSLLFTGMAVWQTSRGFSKHGTSSAYGWIYGGIAAGFYLGNIYGSFKAASKHNETINHKFFHRLDEIIDRVE